MPTDAKISYAEQQRRAHVIYNAKIRSLISDENADKHVMIDILSGDYEIGENQATTMRHLRERQPDAVMHHIHRHKSYVGRVRSPRRLRKTEENQGAGQTIARGDSPVPNRHVNRQNQDLRDFMI